MDRYFFDVTNDIADLPDEEGILLPDIASARRAAENTIGAIITEEILAGRKTIHLTVRVQYGPDRTHLFSLQSVTSIITTSPQS